MSRVRNRLNIAPEEGSLDTSVLDSIPMSHEGKTVLERWKRYLSMTVCLFINLLSFIMIIYVSPQGETSNRFYVDIVLSEIMENLKDLQFILFPEFTVYGLINYRNQVGGKLDYLIAKSDGSFVFLFNKIGYMFFLFY